MLLIYLFFAQKRGSTFFLWTPQWGVYPPVSLPHSPTYLLLMLLVLLLQQLCSLIACRLLSFNLLIFRGKMICFHYIRAFWLWVILQSPFSLSLFLAQFKSNTKYALGTCWRTPARNLGVVPDVWCRNKRKLAISNICLEEEFLMVVVEVLVWYKNNLCSQHRIGIIQYFVMSSISEQEGQLWMIFKRSWNERQLQCSANRWYFFVSEL